jgi:hypothetical protein
MSLAPKNGTYEEVICLEDYYLFKNGVKLLKGLTYRKCLSGYGYLKQNICGDDECLLEVNGFLWSVKENIFVTKNEWRELKLKSIGIE